MVKKKDRGAILGLRAVVILQIAVTIGVVAGWLSYLTTPITPAAVTVGLAAAGGSLVVLHKIIDPN